MEQVLKIITAADNIPIVAMLFIGGDPGPSVVPFLETIDDSGLPMGWGIVTRRGVDHNRQREAPPAGRSSSLRRGREMQNRAAPSPALPAAGEGAGRVFGWPRPLALAESN